MNRPPTFSENILGELINEEEKDTHEHNSERNENFEEGLEKKKGKKKVSFKTQP